MLEPVPGLSATFDYYSVKIDHQIVPGSDAGAALHSQGAIGQFFTLGVTLRF